MTTRVINGRETDKGELRAYVSLKYLYAKYGEKFASAQTGRLDLNFQYSTKYTVDL
jgi:predicted secreted protein